MATTEKKTAPKAATTGTKAATKPAATKAASTAKKPASTTPKKPTSAALQAAVAQLEEQETGKRKNTVIFRILAFVLWALAAAAMYLPQIGTLELPFGACRMLFLNNVTVCIIDIIVAGVLCIIAALLWKHANHIHPVKSDNKFIQLVWNQLGIIMAGIIMAPLAIVLIVKNDELEEKTKRIIAAVLAVVFLAAAAGSADYHPVTQAEVDQVIEEATADGAYSGQVYWTKYGRCYHYYLDCQSLRNTDEGNLYKDGLEVALESNRVNLCSFCDKRAIAEAAAEDEVDVEE